MAPEKGRRKYKIPRKITRLASPHSRLCPSGCGCYSLSAMDTHKACPACLGILHARTALGSPDSCPHCSQMSLAMRKRSKDIVAKAMSGAAARRATGGPLAPEPELENMDL